MADADPSEYGQIVVVESPERLPIGWKEKMAIKKGEEVKVYYNVITGLRFYSKGELLRYVELGSPSQGTRQRMRKQNEGSPENRLMLMPAVPNNAPEWLPSGWIVELNATSNGTKYKKYIDPSTGRKFHSKPEILKYLNSDECNDPAAKEIAMSIISASNALPVGTDETPEWLPQGWIMEVKTRTNGKKFKRYIDPLTRQKFYSKPAVMTFLNSGKSNDPTSEQTAMSIVSYSNPQKPEWSQSLKGTNSTSSRKQMHICNSRKKRVEVLRYEAEQLPPGWIKEIKIERIGDKIRRDPFYTDPDSKYVFRSVPDALRYLETKDIKMCAMRPKKREELEFLNDDKSLHASEENQLLLLENTTEECTAKEENQDPTSSQQPITTGSKRKRGRPVAAPAPDYINQQGKQAEVIDSTKSEGEKVSRSLCTPSTQIAGSEPDNVQNITEEPAASDNIAIKKQKGEEQNLEPQPLERLGGESSLYPCMEFAFKTLRGDVPVEANNLAAQGYNHQQRASVNVRLPSFSDYARRQM